MMEIDADTKAVVLEWVGKNLVPAPLRALGGLIVDPLNNFRLNRQIDMYIKTRDKCIKNNIKTRVIPPKLVYPFLELGSLEDDQYLQEKWVNLFVSMVDSNNNLQNHVFPSILSQLSKDEYQVLESHLLGVLEDLDEMDEENEQANVERDYLASLMDELEKSGNIDEDDDLILRMSQASNVTMRNYEYRKQILTFQFINLREFEIANLLRLGVIETVPLSFVSSESMRHDGQLNVEVHHERYDYRISELGEILLRACFDYNRKAL